MRLVVCLSLCLAYLLVTPANAILKDTPPQHGIDLYGSLKYPTDFTHYDYVNPNAPKGGSLTLDAVGTFDSLNAFVIKGTPVVGMGLIHPSHFYATLMAHSHDEPISAYGYIAKTVQVTDGGKSVTFTLRPEAQFHDGTPITAEDVVFTFNILKEKGNPVYRSYYHEITKATALDSHTVRFDFVSNENKELPVIIGELPILSKKYYETHDFEDAGMEMPLGNGPYKISEVDPGKSITYERVEDWWGKDLPVNKGQYNFDEIKFLYFLDSTVALEAFKAGDVDFRLENLAKNWANSYNFPAVENGQVIKSEIPHEMTQGMQGLVFNIRRPLFQDIRVRKALSLAFDFEWTNKNLFYDSYTRSNSYFANSDLGARGIPDGEELELLSAFRDDLPDALFKMPFKMPVNNTPSDIRAQLLKARDLLSQAGWEIKNGVLTYKDTNIVFEFEILVVMPSTIRVINSYCQNLKKLGIKTRVRLVDASQYMERIESFDYDMIFGLFPQSESPGNEQMDYWGSRAADFKGSRNYIGIKNPVVDALIDEMIDAPSRESLVESTRALDRVLLWNFYMVPGYHSKYHRVAYWNKFDRPAKPPKYGLGIDSWWSKDLSPQRK